MRGYKAVLFAPDGDWVTDLKGDTKGEVKEQLADRGSRWFFYPYEGIILDKGGLTKGSQRVVDLWLDYPELIDLPIELIGKSIKTVSRWIADATSAYEEQHG